MLRRPGPRPLREVPKLFSLSPSVFGLWLSSVLALAALIVLAYLAA